MPPGNDTNHIPEKESECRVATDGDSALCDSYDDIVTWDNGKLPTHVHNDLSVFSPAYILLLQWYTSLTLNLFLHGTNLLVLYRLSRVSGYG